MLTAGVKRVAVMRIRWHCGHIKDSSVFHRERAKDDLKGSGAGGGVQPLVLVYTMCGLDG